MSAVSSRITFTALTPRSAGTELNGVQSASIRVSDPGAPTLQRQPPLGMQVLTSTPIQTTQSTPGSFHKTPRFRSLGRRNAGLVNSENECNLLTRNASLNEWQDITQEPAHVSALNGLLKTRARTFRRWLSQTNTAAPTLDIKVNNFVICVSQDHPRLRQVPPAVTCESHGAFTIETSSDPTQFPYRRFLERTLSFVGKPCLQPRGVTFFIAGKPHSLTTNPTSTRAVAGPNIEIIRRPSMSFHAVCLVAGRQPHIQRVS